MESFYAFVLHKRYEGMRWFGHFGGKFDIRFIIETIRQVHPRAKFHFNISGSAIINFSVIKDRGGKTRKWYFVDSYRLLKASLDKLTRQFDVEHKKLEFDPNSIQYNKNDCVGLYEVLQKFFDVHGICSETIASHAMKVFRTHYLKKRIPVPHEDVEEFVRSCYYGGRCEVFRWDQADLDLFDINSMYPWAMKGLIPVEYRARSTQIPDSDEQGIGFYEAEIDYPEMYAPCLPWYHDKLYFPVGKMIARVTSMELRQAISDGAKVKIRRGCVFDVDYIFNEYVDDIYKMKREAKARGDKALEFIAKLLLNSLYGKFGQRRDQVAFAMDPGTPFLYGDDGPPVWPIGTDGRFCFYHSRSTSAHILPHIAATITARSRLQLLRYIREAGEVWYSDTDSIFTPNQVQTSAELGDMSHDGSGPFRAYGVKEYVFNGIPKVKGISLVKTDPKTGEKTEDFSSAFSFFAGSEVRERVMPGILESIRAGKPLLRYVDRVKMKHVTMPKRAPDGPFQTRPWTTGEILDKTIRKTFENMGILAPESVSAAFFLRGIS